MRPPPTTPYFCFFSCSLLLPDVTHATTTTGYYYYELAALVMCTPCISAPQRSPAACDYKLPAIQRGDCLAVGLRDTRLALLPTARTR